MKATIKITIMLMAMTIGTLAASAQSASRQSSRDQQRKSTSKVESQAQRPKTNQATKTKQQASPRTQSSRSQAVKPSARASSPSSRSHTRNATQQPQVDTRKPDQRPEVSTRTSTQRSTSVRKSETRTPVSVNSRKTSSQSRNSARINNSSTRTGHNGNTFKDPRNQVEVRDNRTVKGVDRNQNSRSSHVVVHHDYNHVRNHYHYPAKRVKYHVHPATYHNHYRVVYYPVYRDVVWTRRLHRYYVDIYPGYVWRYPIGYRIQTISAFDARFNVGEVARVYGRVYATWFNREADELFLFFGGEYPNQEFTMILPGHIARRYSWRPDRYFLGQHVVADGLITSFQGQAELIIKKKKQLDVY